jgi:hypothetical protein
MFSTREPKPVFASDGRLFYGASQYHVFDGNDILWNAVINLSPYPENRLALQTEKRGGQYFLIHCQNNATPSLTKVEWDKLLWGLPQGNIVVCCVGGRGRTGLALSVFRSLLIADSKDVVQEIRTLYENEAVETQTQLDYVTRITGKPTACKPAYNDFFSTYYAYGI